MDMKSPVSYSDLPEELRFIEPRTRKSLVAFLDCPNDATYHVYEDGGPPLGSVTIRSPHLVGKMLANPVNDDEEEILYHAGFQINQIIVWDEYNSTGDT